MKLRITPLNFLTTLLLAVAVYIWINGAGIVGGPYQQLHLGGTLTWIFFLFAFVIFIVDLMFRNFFPKTKTLWIIESAFVVFVAVIFFLLIRK
ncbi:hypothetical protein [Mucilaginibacter myungsuensis]|uniref:Uncharacterized protein n=1 Tax=Mucilaginibacter myungsuensis TaxID=649104 RepID=A0A929KX00_9SPHI|nr:hypothetical protein [Mucilaginibacter myungsuensis]MBE9660449.1 hypothetical protein [Mucilaginibacter myungsuensis]MDN3600491.1 hypothetical protein [Mucilaginibacter myungsuensis]